MENGGYYNAAYSNGSLYCGNFGIYVSCYDKTTEKRAEETSTDD